MAYTFVRIAESIDGPKIATDEISGINYQLAKQVFGGEGVATPVSKANPMPVWDAFPSQVALGNITGYSQVRAGGAYDLVGDTAAWRIIRAANNTALNFPSSAQVHTIASSSANDTSAGTGARTVTVVGLSSAGAIVSDTVTMNGTTGVDTVVEFLRVNELYVATAGAGLTNAGAISCTAKDDATAAQSIAAGESVSRTTVYTVPDGKTGVILAWRTVHGANSGGNQVILSARIMSRGSGEPDKVRDSVIEFVEGPIDFVYENPIVLTENTDVWVEGYNHTANDCVLNSSLEILLIDNNS